MQRARIKLVSTDIEKINQTCDFIRDIVDGARSDGLADR